MRSTRTVQPSVFQAPEVVHPVAAELERASAWLDQHPELLDMIGTCVPGSTGLVPFWWTGNLWGS